ncbi:MAG TPA: glycerate kinase [Gemmataceae bacterium]|nr:glycerate kinase [Gemmataceae bacterium]
MRESALRQHARDIWQAGLAAAKPEPLVQQALREFQVDLAARRILVVGAGKAGPAMARGLESALGTLLDRAEGVVNVPADAVKPLRKIVLHAGRPAGSNHPAPEGVAGAERMLALLAGAGPDDIAICLISGGGSALLPAPAEGVSLTDKQATTKLLHACGANINEMNAVRKHLSRIKGGRLAQSFRGKKLIALIISDVVGDPLDVIASGPTVADPTTFADAIAVLRRYDLWQKVPETVRRHLERGQAGEIPETPKQISANVVNRIIGRNADSLAAAQAKAKALGYHVLNLGSFIEGETREVAIACAGVLRAILANEVSIARPACILLGGETTVTLGDNPGKGGRNQEFVLAMLGKLGESGLQNVAILSGGTDGEDGPTDAAGVVASAQTLAIAGKLGLQSQESLARHDAYSFFAATGDLIKTGPTETNVMDIRVLLIG